MEEYSLDKRHADKWLGEERIAELEHQRQEMEKEKSRQSVQISLADLEDREDMETKYV